MIAQRYGIPGGTVVHYVLLSDVAQSDEPDDATHTRPSDEECADPYYDREVSVSFSSIVFSTTLTPGKVFSLFKVVNSAGLISNLYVFRSDFVSFELPASVGLVLMFVAAAPSESQLLLFLGGSFTVQCMHFTRLACRRALHIASVVSKMQGGCKQTVGVSSYFPLILMLACYLFPQDWDYLSPWETEFTYWSTHAPRRGCHL
jgi:hypothetical protein